MYLKLRAPQLLHQSGRGWLQDTECEPELCDVSDHGCTATPSELKGLHCEHFQHIWAPAAPWCEHVLREQSSLGHVHTVFCPGARPQGGRPCQLLACEHQACIAAARREWVTRSQERDTSVEARGRWTDCRWPGKGDKESEKRIPAPHCLSYSVLMMQPI